MAIEDPSIGIQQREAQVASEALSPRDRLSAIINTIANWDGVNTDLLQHFKTPEPNSVSFSAFRNSTDVTTFNIPGFEDLPRGRFVVAGCHHDTSEALQQQTALLTYVPDGGKPIRFGWKITDTDRRDYSPSEVDQEKLLMIGEQIAVWLSSDLKKIGQPASVGNERPFHQMPTRPARR